MTNREIIFAESLKAFEKGLLKETGRKITVTLPDGTQKEINELEEIHTFNGWKERGYSVKKGEKSKIKFPIWKFTAKKIETENKNGEIEESEKTNMFLKLSAFFTSEQVEPIKA